MWLWRRTKTLIIFKKHYIITLITRAVALASQSSRTNVYLYLFIFVFQLSRGLNIPGILIRLHWPLFWDWGISVYSEAFLVSPGPFSHSRPSASEADLTAQRFNVAMRIHLPIDWKRATSSNNFNKKFQIQIKIHSLAKMNQGLVEIAHFLWTMYGPNKIIKKRD